MNTSAILELTEQLISIPSVSGHEAAVCERIEQELQKVGWEPTRIPVATNRWSVFTSVGTPTIVFSTHLDVVPASENLFQPRFDGSKLTGRGACDAKGVAATMIAAAKSLQQSGRTNFGLLFVVGEEVDGIGAQRAKEFLKNAGISWIINGEPTEGKIMRGHKGHLGVEIRCTGKACHSGYPHLGDDANAKLVAIAHRLMSSSWGEDPILGKGSINLGQFQGGEAWNVVSPEASLRCIVRTVGNDNHAAEALLRTVVRTDGEIKVLASAVPKILEVLPGFESDVASFGTDIPNFGTLAEHYVLYGPGSIHVAHTDHESISIDEVEQAADGYRKIFDLVSSRISAKAELQTFL